MRTLVTSGTRRRARAWIAAMGTVAALAMSAAPAAPAGAHVVRHVPGELTVTIAGGFTQPEGQLERDFDWGSGIRNSGFAMFEGWNAIAFADVGTGERVAVGAFAGRAPTSARAVHVSATNGSRELDHLVRATTTFTGLHARCRRPIGRAWTASWIAGGARFERELDLSSSVRAVDPSTAPGPQRDDAWGFIVGAMGEYALGERIGVGVSGLYLFSGGWREPLRWMGSGTDVGSWELVTLDAAITFRACGPR